VNTGSNETVKKKAEIIKIDQVHSELAFSRCREVIASGGVIVYPTDTYYGLGADPRNPRAVKKIFEIKKRPAGQPILLLIAGQAEVADWVEDVPSQAADLMRRHWPGPLTLIFRANLNVLSTLTAGTGSIGLRVPGSELTRDLLRSLGFALTGTSANQSGQPSISTAAEAELAIGDRVDLILDGGETPGGKPSTVVDISTGILRVLREGAIPLRNIAA
jgi:L-threonylcarbamoyladenylate synthase